MQLNPEDTLLLECTQRDSSHFKSIHFSESVSAITQWDVFVHNAITNRLAPIVFRAFSAMNDSSAIPQPVLDELQKHYYRSLSKNTVLYDYAKIIISKWNDLGIRAIILKGIFLADSVYEDIAIRQLSDIDILVPVQDAEKCAAILLEMGFVYDNSLVKSDFMKQTKDNKHLPMLVKNGIGIEIHTSLFITDSIFHIPIPDFYQHSKQFIVADFPVLAFEANYQLLHICMHLDEHFVDANIHFIAYVDILWFVQKYKEAIDWSAFDEMCASYNCVSNVYVHLYLCHKYLKAPIPESIIEKAKSYCEPYKEVFFVNHLQCNNQFAVKKRNRNITELKKVKGFRKKIRFLLDDMFPSKTFMYVRYSIKNPKALCWFYIVRQWDGIVSLLKYIFRIKVI